MALVELGWSLVGALVEPGWSLGGAWVALGGRNQLAINTLWGGLSVAWGWLYCGFTLALLSHYCRIPLPIPSQSHGFTLALGGFDPPFCIFHSALCIQGAVRLRSGVGLEAAWGRPDGDHARL